MQNLSVIIIGTGFSGLCMGIKLKEAGNDNFTIFEKGEEVGGVWRANTYPGACCDIPANLYSFSFAMKTDWPRRYPAQPLIQSYMKSCAEEYGLYPHIQFNTEISSASFDKETGLWSVTTATGEVHQANILMSGVGQLGRPAYPTIKGMDNFTGKAFHSADWDHDYDLTGKSVAVIGTGASAIQFIPVIAEQAGELKVFQRTPPYIMPKPDEVYTAAHRFLFKNVPGFQKFYRAFWYGSGELASGAFDRGSKLAKVFEKVTLAHMRKHVKDPGLRKKLTPDYPVGCKRVLFASNYFPALARPNVDVVTEDVVEMTETGIRTADGEHHEVDAVIYGTGFKATEFLSPMRITGLDEKDLNEAWNEGAEAYLGMSTNGFPNFFMLYGPNTNLGSNSIVFMIECQANYIMQCLKKLAAEDSKFLDIRADVQREYNDHIQQRLKNSVWSAGCSSWYHNDAGKITNNWPGYTREYKKLTKTMNPADYEFTPA